MGSVQTPIGMRSSALLETSCGYLLQELEMIWDEVGEDKFEREKVLLDLEEECVDVYRRKVDRANISRARLHQKLADSEAEFTHLLLSLGERSLPGRVTLFICPLFPSLSDVSTLSATLGMDSSMIITKVHPSLNELSGLSKNISDSILSKLNSTVESLEAEKQARIEKVPLLAMMEEYNMLRQEKEEEKQRQREKKVQPRVVSSPENVFVTRPNTSYRRVSDRSLNGGFSNASPINRRLSLGIQQLGSNSINSPTQGISFIKEGKKSHGHKKFTRSGFNSHPKDDTASVVSTFSGPFSP